MAVRFHTTSEPVAPEFRRLAGGRLDRAPAALDARPGRHQALRTALTGMRRRAHGWTVRARGSTRRRAACAAPSPRPAGPCARRGEARQGEAQRTGRFAACHDWRRHLKFHWNHCALLGRIKPGRMSARRAQARDLADSLGDHHDLAIFRHRLAGDAAAWRLPAEVAATFEALAAADTARIEAPAFALAPALLRDRPKALARQGRKWWNAA